MVSLYGQIAYCAKLNAPQVEVHSMVECVDSMYH